jgi:hypothetical protein
MTDTLPDLGIWAPGCAYCRSENHGIARPERWIRLCVLHSTEGTNRPGSALDLAQDFRPRAKPGQGRSYHFVLDDWETVQLVPEAFEAWAAGETANRCGIHVALVGRSAREDWPARPAWNRAAELCAGICARHGLGLAFVEAASFPAQCGLTSHNQCRIAWHETTHIDPGGVAEEHWDWAAFVRRVRDFAGV